MNKKTAVDWLIDELRSQIKQGTLDAISISELKMKAKAMEKQQIMRTARQCYFEGVRKRAKTTEELIEYAEQYYNETYK